MLNLRHLPRFQNDVFSIRSMRPNPEPRTKKVGDTYNCLYDINCNVLRRYALMALADRGMLSVRSYDPEKEPDKKFDHIVYGDDINYRFGKTVMFANNTDLDKLMTFLKDKVGPERMQIFKRNIGLELDEVEKVGVEYLKKWRSSDEEWPLK